MPRKVADAHPLRNPPHVVSMGENYRRVHEWERYLRDVSRNSGLDHLTDAFRARLSGSARSIDWFLRNNAEFEEIAKLHIAAVLLNCEKPPHPSSDWYREFARRALPTHTKTFEGMLSIITFNYDRSLERYFLTVLESDYGLSPSDAEQELSKVKIEHVYGQLGTIRDIPYGDISHIADAARGISLTRATVDQTIHERVAPLLAEATYINFIGFAFDPDNVAVLGTNGFHGKRIYATSRGLSPLDQRRAQTVVRARFPKHLAGADALKMITDIDLFGPKRKKEVQRPSSTPRPSSFRRRWLDENWRGFDQFIV